MLKKKIFAGVLAASTLISSCSVEIIPDRGNKTDHSSEVTDRTQEDPVLAENPDGTCSSLLNMIDKDGYLQFIYNGQPGDKLTLTVHLVNGEELIKSIETDEAKHVESEFLGIKYVDVTTVDVHAAGDIGLTTECIMHKH